jgi:peroxiredoxin
MTISLILARIALIIVFAIAGLAKLSDRAGTRKALLSFGFPKLFVSPLGILLPLAEIIVVAMLLPTASVWYGALGSVFLLLAFIVAIGANLVRGRQPDCHCFGQLHSEPAGWATFSRNSALLCLALFLAWGVRVHASPSLLSWILQPNGIVRLAFLSNLVLLSLGAVVIWQLMLQQGRILVRLDDLNPQLHSGTVTGPNVPETANLRLGSSAPDFRLDDITGTKTTLQDLLADAKPVLLLFTNPNCGPCKALLPEVAQWQHAHNSRLTVALISEGTTEDNEARLADFNLAHVLLQLKREVAEQYQAWGTPAALVIQPDGTVGTDLAQGAEQIRLLVSRSVDVSTRHAIVPPKNPQKSGKNDKTYRLPAPRQMKVGDALPTLKLHNLEGMDVTQSAFRGRKTLLLFWNPQCGFCQRMLDDLRHWDSNPPPGAPALVVVSTGTIESGLEMGLRSLILLDPTRTAAHAFRAHGTPMAVLLDEEGAIASDVAAGAAAFFRLGNSGQTEVVEHLSNAR